MPYSSLDIFGISNEDLARGLAGMQALSQAIGAISALAAANAQMQVAAIDRQIEAEKRLDGNSKASIAKIDAMEKKKTAIKRKAFEEDKKIGVIYNFFSLFKFLLMIDTDF